jgi:hypothetical protein
LTTLPKHISVETTRHGKKVLYFRRGQGSRVRMPNDINSPDFIQLYEQLLDRQGGIITTRGVGLMRSNYIKDMLVQKIKAAVVRDRRLGREADIDLSWALNQIAIQNHACALTGIAFQYQGLRNGRLNPYSPSLDRIDNARGYEKANVRIVLSAINLMILDWGDDVFDKVAGAYIANKRSRTPNPVRESTSKTPNKIRA